MVKLEKSTEWKLFLLLVVSFFVPSGLFADEQAPPGIEEKATEARLEVIKAKLTEERSLLEIQYRIRGVFGNPNVSTRYARSAYVVDEGTGETFRILRFSRIGALGQKNLSNGPISFVKIDNTQEKIKKGARITFVIAGLRQEHIIVEE